MVDPHDVLVLHSTTKLRQWREQGALFHPPSNATLLLSPLMVDAVKVMQTGSKSLDQISAALCGEYPDLVDSDKQAIYESLEQGITSLMIDGIVAVQH